MPRRYTGPWLWADAMSLLEQAERLQRQFFHTVGRRAGPPHWEPPADVYERGDGLLIEIALPGVAPEDVALEFAESELVLRAQRRLRQCQTGARIRSLEIPYGLFERRLKLPQGAWVLAGQEFVNGCLRLVLSSR